MDLPVDRSRIGTERRHERSHDLDTLDSESCIALLIDDQRDVAAAVEAARGAVARFVDALVPRVQAGGRLVYLGAGTSGRLGVLDAAECPPTFRADPGQIVGVIAGGDASLRRSSESREDDPDGAEAALSELGLGPPDTLLGIAAGGTTPYVLGGLRIAADRGAMTGLLVCTPLATTPPGCAHLMVADTGPELLTGSTRLKAGSATKLVLNAITTTLFVRLGKTYGNLMVDLRATNDKLHDRAIRILIALCPGVSREAAARTIQAAGGHLKTAIVMERLGVERADAERLLDEHAGRLRAVVG